MLDESTPIAGWIPVGELVVPSGLLLVGDPGMLKEYAPYPMTLPIDRVRPGPAASLS
jgi:hypothetical protein